MIEDALYFLRVNLTHYALALWGFRLRFDPPYRHVTRFFPSLIAEPVFEYRTYGAHAVWAMFLAGFLPIEVLTLLICWFSAVTVYRARFLRSPLHFWRQVVKENGLNYRRGHGRYMEQLIREMEVRMKAGDKWEHLALEAQRLQDEVIRAAASQEAAKTILGGR